MRWTAPGYEAGLEALLAALAEATWPEPPEGFTYLTQPRPMRAVLTGTLAGPRGPKAVVVKWNRPDTLADRVSRHVRGGKGVREGSVLRALKRASLRVPEPLAYTDEGDDVLVTAYVTDLTPLPPADEMPPPLLEDVAILIALAHAAGLRHPDLHTGNLALHDGAPILVDLGSARMGAPLGERERLAALAAATHGLLGDARRSQRLRALRLYMRQVHGGNGRGHARTHARAIEDLLRSVQRSFRRGRDRRATRSGKHFELFATPSGAHGVRNRDCTDATWIARTEPWLETLPDNLEELKSGGAVHRKGDLVLKSYDRVATGRLPRPIRAFRLAYALRNRGIEAPLPYLAVADSSGAGLYVAAWVDAPNLHDFVASGRFDALEAEEHTRLLVGLGRTLRRMHDAEVTHRDLKAPNLLVLPDLGIMIADVDGARVRRGPVRWARRARDLMRLDASLDLRERDRVRILASYHAALPFPPEPLPEFAGEVARLAQRKRGPSGLPR